MLVEFSVKNFKSFKERQTLSMVAAKSDKSLPENLIHVDIPGLKDTNLLKSAVIYGANASGKSNLIYAFGYLLNYVVNSFRNLSPNESIDRHYFLLDELSVEDNTEFELTFILDNILHTFGFVLNNDRVVEEWLYVYQSPKPQTWFHRKYDKNSDKYNWYLSPTYLKGEKDSIKESTRDNILYLSTAAHLKHLKLAKIFDWFAERFLHYSWYETTGNTSVTAGLIFEEKIDKNVISLMLQSADLGIADIEVDLINIEKLIENDNVPEVVKNKFAENHRQKKILDIKFYHKNESLSLRRIFEQEIESEGTLNFFSLIGPLMLSLRYDVLIMIDELTSTLHPSLVHTLIKVMNKIESKSQIILTTHDTTLLDRELFRRDQIWFTEKNNNGESYLYPLTDYKPRKDESLERGYLAGRYGAIPFISKEFMIE